MKPESHRNLSQDLSQIQRVYSSRRPCRGALYTASPASNRTRRTPLRWGGQLFVLLLAVLLASYPAAPGHAAPQSQSAGDPLVLAFYYSWYDENTWTHEKLSDLPAETYVSRDRGAMGRHIDQARSAGIDALLLAWYGPGGGPNQTETNLAAMLDEASARGYRIGVLFETTSPFIDGVGGVSAALQHLLDTHANHPAFLRVDGRPVIFFWRPTLYGVEAWRSVRAQVDPDYNSIWISEGVDTSYLSVFDGHHLYSNTWNPPADLNQVNQKFANQVNQARQTYDGYKFWVATVMPGYNDVKIRPGAGFAQDRGGGDYFARSWQAAIAGSPNWIVINSFNEWPEGSYIEPSQAFGDSYLHLSAQYSSQFKAGGGTDAAVAAPAAPLPPPATPTPTPVPTVPTAFVDTALLNVRAGPTTDTDIVGQAPNGTALTISGRHESWPDWWQVRFEEETAWVYAPLVTTGGPMEQVGALGDSAVSAWLSPDATPPPSTASVGGDTVELADRTDEPVGAAQESTLLQTPALLPAPDQEPIGPYLSR